MDKKLLLGIVAVIAVVAVGYWLTGSRSPEPEAPETPAAENAPAVTAADLEGRSFRMISYNGTDVPAEADYALEFGNGSLHAKICNTMNGNATLAGGTMQGMLASTLMFCAMPAGIMDVENGFQTLLSSGAAVSLDGNRLTLSADGGPTIVFIER